MIYDNLTEAEIERALSHLDPNCERETWARVGMALKSELGHAGFDMWEAWSMRADNYNSRDARDTWRSIGASGGVTISTLIYMAKEAGYRPDAKATTIDPAQANARKERREADQRRDAEEREQAKASAAQKASEIWSSSAPAKDDHPYLRLKGVKAHNVREYKNQLVVPVRDAALNIQSLQFISPEGEKRFLSGGAIAGNYSGIGKPSSVVYICEGYATAASIREATGEAVVIAFNAGNLEPVAKAIRAKLPSTAIRICADNDVNTPGNPGISSAKRAAAAVGGVVIAPDAGDFNDMHSASGLEAVKQALIATPANDNLPSPVANDPVNDMCRDWAFVAGQRKFIHVPTMRMLDVDAFNLEHIHIMNDVPEAKKMKPAEFVRRIANSAVVHDLMYLPTMWNGDPFFMLDGVKYLNTYNATSVPSLDQNWRDHDAWQICLDHLKNIMPNDWEQLLRWMAHNVQNPGRKILWAPVIVGMPGDGKTTVAKMLTAAMGRKHTQVVGPETLNSDFNGWAEGKCVTTFEEIRAKGHSRHDFMNKLKPLITNEVVDVVAKGKNSRNVVNTQNYLALSNYRDALVLDADDRRWGVFFTRFESRAQVEREMDKAYWAQLNDYAIKENSGVVRGWLMSIDLSDFNPNEGPTMTDAKRYMIGHSLSSDAQSIAEIVGAGAYGVNHDVVETKALNDALKMHEGRAMQTSRMATALRELGFRKVDKTLKWNGRPCWIWTRPPFVVDESTMCRERIRQALDEHKPPNIYESNY